MSTWAVLHATAEESAAVVQLQAAAKADAKMRKAMVYHNMG